MQYFYAIGIILIFVVLVIIALNIDIIVKKLSFIEDLMDRIANALEKIINQDNDE